jgi:hypothetical protein
MSQNMSERMPTVNSTDVPRAAHDYTLAADQGNAGAHGWTGMISALAAVLLYRVCVRDGPGASDSPLANRSATSANHCGLAAGKETPFGQFADDQGTADANDRFALCPLSGGAFSHLALFAPNSSLWKRSAVGFIPDFALPAVGDLTAALLAKLCLGRNGCLPTLREECPILGARSICETDEGR